MMESVLQGFTRTGVHNLGNNELLAQCSHEETKAQRSYLTSSHTWLMRASFSCLWLSSCNLFIHYIPLLNQPFVVLQHAHLSLIHVPTVCSHLHAAILPTSSLLLIIITSTHSFNILQNLILFQEASQSFWAERSTMFLTSSAPSFNSKAKKEIFI